MGLDFQLLHPVVTRNLILKTGHRDFYEKLRTKEKSRVVPINIIGTL